MTLQTDLETAVAQVTADSQKLKDVVNGPETGAGSTVDVDSGPVKTVARALAEIGDTTHQALKDLTNVADADFTAKAVATGVDGDLKASGNLAGLADVAVARTNLGLTKGVGAGNVVEVQTGGKIAEALYERHPVSVTQATLNQNDTLDVFTATDEVTAKKRLVQIYEEELGTVLSEDFASFSKPYDSEDTSTWASVESFSAIANVIHDDAKYGTWYAYPYGAPGGLTANGDTNAFVGCSADESNNHRIHFWKYDPSTNVLTNYVNAATGWPWASQFIAHMGGTRYFCAGYQRNQWDARVGFLDVASAGLSNVTAQTTWGNQWYPQSCIYLAPDKGVQHTNNGGANRVAVVTDNGGASAPSLSTYVMGAPMAVPCRVDDTHFLLPTATALVKLMKVTGSTITEVDGFTWAGHAAAPELTYVRLASGKIWAFSAETSEAKILSVAGDVITVEATTGGVSSPGIPQNWTHRQRTTMKEIVTNTFLYLKRVGSNPYSVNLHKGVIDETTADITTEDLGEILSTTDLGDYRSYYQFTGDGPDWTGDHAFFTIYNAGTTDAGAWTVGNASKSAQPLAPAYAFAFDGGSTFRIWDGVAARDIASNLSGVHGGTEGEWFYWDGAAWQVDASNSRDTAVAAAIDADPGNVTTDDVYAALTAADWSSFGWTAGAASSFALFAYERNPAKSVTSVGVGYLSLSSWIMNANPADFEVNSMATGKVSVARLAAGTATVRIIVLGPKE
jgi:hypothetical protein